MTTDPERWDDGREAREDRREAKRDRLIDKLLWLFAATALAAIVYIAVRFGMTS